MASGERVSRLWTASFCILIGCLIPITQSNATVFPAGDRIEASSKSTPTDIHKVEPAATSAHHNMNDTHKMMESQGNEDANNSGWVAGIIIGVVGGVVLVVGMATFCVYKQYMRKNVKSMNFDNPVYRKTTEDQFSLEKNQYQPARSYPANEETLEPLTDPGTNEFV